MKKFFSSFIIILLMLFLSVSVNAEKRDFTFESDNDLYGKFEEAVPEELKDSLFEDSSEYSFEYFAEEIMNYLKNAAGQGIKTFSSLMVIVIIASAFSILSDTMGKKNSAFEFCQTLCLSLALWEVFSSFLQTADTFLNILSDTMLGLVPVLEGALIYSGNAGSAAVQGTGIDLMITFGENVFSKVIFPGAVICFFLAVASSVSENGGIAYLSKTLRGLLTGSLIVIMTLMSFVLALQNGAASAADTFAARTMKFAISSYIPIVGGTVSDSFSCLAGSIGVVKETCGIWGIVTLFLVVIPPLIILLVNRIAIGLSHALAGALNCKRLERILSEAGSVATLVTAVCTGAAAMFMISIGVFCRTLPALGS